MLSSEQRQRLASDRLYTAARGMDGRWSVARASDFVLGTLGASDVPTIPPDLVELLQRAVDAMDDDGERAYAFRSRFAELLAAPDEKAAVRARQADVLRTTANLALYGFDGAIRFATELVLSTVDLEDDETLRLVARRHRLDAASEAATKGADGFRLRDALHCIAEGADAVRNRDVKLVAHHLVRAWENPNPPAEQDAMRDPVVFSLPQVLLFLVDRGSGRWDAYAEGPGGYPPL